MEVDKKNRIDMKFLYHLSNNGQLPLIKWCMMMRLMTKEYKCPNCGRNMKLTERNCGTDGYVWACRGYSGNNHHIKRSIRNYTWFNDSHMSLLTILLISYLWIKKVESGFIVDELSLTFTTVYEWSNYCRQICVEICVLESEVLGGEGMVVEIHECLFSQGKNARCKGVSGKWLIIGVDKNTNKYFFRVSQCKNKETLLNVIKDWILPGSIIISDLWNAYNCLNDRQFKQLKVNKNLTYQHPEKRRNKATESIFSIVKNLIRGSHTNDVFISHLAEYIWRSAHNNNARSLIESFFSSLAKIFPPQESDYVE